MQAIVINQFGGPEQLVLKVCWLLRASVRKNRHVVHD
jgi:hypothetical protein